MIVEWQSARGDKMCKGCSVIIITVSPSFCKKPKCI